LAALAVIVVTGALVWFLRPNRDSGSTSTVDVTTPTTVAGDTTTSLPTTSVPSDGTVAPTTAPAATSTP
jgi:predicted Abi (CAAX) family protease